jgi:hypothetical protein
VILRLNNYTPFPFIDVHVNRLSAVHRVWTGNVLQIQTVNPYGGGAG